MKGVIGKVVAALGWSGALIGLGGCYEYRDVVDPCYPQRYWYESRQNVQAAVTPQVHNGHVLDQTVWNYHFEEGSDRLTVGGMERLNYLARRRPMADPMVFLQTAHDIRFEKIEDLAPKRSDLDQKRVVAVKKYLAAYTCGSNVGEFEVQVHNPPEVGIAGPASERSILQLYSTPRATLPATGGGGGATGGAGAGTGGQGGVGGGR
jgi:hypothetical protein